MSCTVGELLERLDSYELTEWMIFDGIEPIGDWRLDYNSGMICSLFANANRRKGADAFSPSDFMPFVPKEEKSMEEKAMEGFAKLMQGKK